MVKKKSGRTLNPADAHRKAMRQKEIKKNKAERKRVRTFVMVHKDTSKLEEEIARYRSLDREKRLDKNGKAKLKDLDDKFKKILETKKAHGVNLQKEKEKSAMKEQTPIYFHPTLNPSGLPPPGVSKSDEESFEEADSGSEYSDDDSQAEDKQESDEDIPLPPGSPPAKESDDELPELPPGPPPKKEESDDELPELPPGPPPNLNISYSHSSAMARPSPPPPFGFNHQGLPFPPPPGAFLFNGPLSSPNHQRPNVRQPPLPPPAFAPGPNPFSSPSPSPMHSIQGQGYPVRPLDVPHPRPPPFSSQVSHYGPPPQIPPGGNNNISSRTFSQQTISNNVQSAKTNNSKSAANAVTATPIIQAAPQVRNLQKELTTLIPASLLRRKAAASKPKVARPIVNAAPKIDDGLIDEVSTTTPTKRSASTAIPLLQEQQKSLEVDSSQLKGGITSSSAPSPAKKAKKKKADEYEKFMSEMQDLL